MRVYVPKTPHPAPAHRVPAHWRTGHPQIRRLAPDLGACAYGADAAKLCAVSNRWMQLLPYALAAMSLGVVTETLARLSNAWRYRRAGFVLVNLLVMYGVVQGSLAALVPRRGALVAAALGAMSGLLYEIVNLRWLHWWSFPGQRMVMVRGHVAILAVLTILWGLVPPFAWALRVAWPGDRKVRTLQERFDILVDSEQHLLEKMRIVQERQDVLESRLQAVRAKKRLLEHKLTVRNPAGDPE